MIDVWESRKILGYARIKLQSLTDCLQRANDALEGRTREPEDLAYLEKQVVLASDYSEQMGELLNLLAFHLSLDKAIRDATDARGC